MFTDHFRFYKTYLVAIAAPLVVFLIMMMFILLYSPSSWGILKWLAFIVTLVPMSIVLVSAFYFGLYKKVVATRTELDLIKTLLIIATAPSLVVTISIFGCAIFWALSQSMGIGMSDAFLVTIVATLIWIGSCVSSAKSVQVLIAYEAA